MANFCDSHVHVVGDPARYPLATQRTYRPGLAPLARLEALARPLGVDRFVVVQPSFYGTDNRATLDALAALGARGRGVAVIDPAATDAAALDAMARAGVRGLRMNLYSTAPGAPPVALADAFGRQARVAGAHGWHVQVIAPLPVLAQAADVLAGAPVPVVIDHYGLPGGYAPDAPAARTFLDLARLPHVWVKLSAPYRLGDEGAVRPDPAWLAALLQAAPARCVWGSDWPHTPPHAAPDPDRERPYRDLDYRTLLDGFRAALPPDVLPERILRDNPARLYGFTDASPA